MCETGSCGSCDSCSSPVVPIGPRGNNGDSAYVYIAWASAADGTGFTTTFNASLQYIAIISSTEPLVPDASDFTGRYCKYKGDNGTNGNSAYVYIAYASDNTGTGFTTTFNAALNYIGVKSSTTPLTPVVGDFAGLWFNYKGATGNNGTDGSGYTATSVTSHSITVGSKTFTTQAGLAYLPNSRVRLSSSTTRIMEGMVTAYNTATGSFTVNITDLVDGSGTGPFTSWNIALAGEPAPTTSTWTNVSLASVPVHAWTTTPADSGLSYTSAATTTYVVANTSFINTGTTCYFRYRIDNGHQVTLAFLLEIDWNGDNTTYNISQFRIDLPVAIASNAFVTTHSYLAYQSDVANTSWPAGIFAAVVNGGTLRLFAHQLIDAVTYSGAGFNYAYDDAAWIYNSDYKYTLSGTITYEI